MSVLKSASKMRVEAEEKGSKSLAGIAKAIQLANNRFERSITVQYICTQDLESLREEGYGVEKRFGQFDKEYYQITW